MEGTKMHDMLVKLYELDEMQGWKIENVVIRKPIGPEKHLVIEWVRHKFNKAWASETDAALSNNPATCYIALHDTKLAGFGCYDATALGYFGPTGVVSPFRHKGIGTALLKTCLLDMRNKGYGYAIIGGVGPEKFYKKAVGAVNIPESTPGIWKTWLR